MSVVTFGNAALRRLSMLETAKNWVLYYQKEAAAALVITITASLSFGLGYLANREFDHAPIVIEACHSNILP